MARRKRRFSPGTDRRSVPGENERIEKSPPFFLWKKSQEIGGNKASLPFFKMFFPSHFMARKKTREWEETLLCRRKSLAIFDGRGRVPRKFYEFSGDREEKIEDFFIDP